ncbi:MAG: YCF48-related protein, partial [Ignavibacteria bacterium]|nr:YCF48-related protein [Ignavibacteria bacterium]
CGLLSTTIIAQNFWQHTGGPIGGTAVCVVEADNGDMVLGTTEGAFRSSDAGTSWTLSENGMGSTNYITDLFKHSNGDIYIFGTDRILGQSRLFRSTDNGQNWTEIPNVPLVPATTPTQLVVVNSSGDIFVGGTIVGSFIISRSTDNGANWTTVFSPSGVFGIISDLGINSNGDLFVSVSGDVDKGVHRSTDNGDTWTQVYTEKGHGLYIHTNDDIYASSDNKVFISTDNGANWTEIYVSGAFLWQPLSVSVTSSGNIFVGTTTGTGGNGVERSTDNGTTWEYVNTGIPPSTSFFYYPSINFLFENSAGNIFCGLDSYYAEFSSSGGMGGVYSSTNNGDNWLASDDGLLALDIKGVTVHSNGDLFVQPFAGLLHSSDGGASWSDRSPEVSGAQFEISACSENKLNGNIIIGGPNTLQKSTDFGNYWLEIGGSIFNLLAISGISTNNTGHIFVSTNGGVYRSTDDGANWDQVYTSSASNVFTAPNGYVYTVSFIPAGLYRSTDNGDNWEHLTNGIGNGVTELTIASDNTIYGVDGNGIHRSDDLGDSWVTADNGIPKGSNGLYMFTVYAMATNSAGYIFASIKYLDAQDMTRYDIFRSLNKGNNWSTLSNGLMGAFTFANDISVDSDDFAYLGATNGVYRSLYATDVPREENKSIPVTFNLEQNFPNPFNPNTKVQYSVPIRSIVVIKIFDILGDEIETLVNEEKAVGSYEITWYADDLPSGVYFYQLKAGPFVETKKMVLMK